MSLTIAELGIEVTRKCNMKCEHCLRGEPQRKNISDQHIYKILQLIDNVGTLTITGGEPTLAMDSLTHIQHCVQYGRADVGSFYMVTNGKSINVAALAEWAKYMRLACGDNELSGVSFSFDKFHVSTFNYAQMEKQERNYRRLKDILENEYGIYDNGWSEFVRKHSDDSWDYHHLFAEGRAEDFGGRNNDHKIFIEDIWEDNINFSDNMLYLSANGYIVSDCNWSYKNIDNDKQIRIAHIDDIQSQDDLIKAIRKYNKRTAPLVLELA